MPGFRPNVALLLVDSSDRLLICERTKPQGAWQFPQGGVDPGESAEEALLREVQEEIGLPPESYAIEKSQGGYRYSFPPEARKRKKGNFEGQEQVYFLCRLRDDAPPIDVDQKPREFRDHRWIAPEDFQLGWLPDFKMKVHRAVLRDFFGVELE